MTVSNGVQEREPTVVKGQSLIAIVWIFAAIVASLLMIASFSVDLMSAGRAYVAGEGLWSKAQKEAVLSLSRYVESRDSAQYQAYLDALQVSLGDRQARLELEKAYPNLDIAAEGFAKGRNNPEDIPGMIRLFRRFRTLAPMDLVISIWTDGDAYMDRLITEGDVIHEAIRSGHFDAKDVQTHLNRLEEINRELTPLEDNFSDTLGQVTREVKSLLQVAMFVTATVLLTIAALISKRIVRQNQRYQKTLMESESQLRRLLQFAPLPIVIVGLDAESIVYANQRALSQFKLADNTWQDRSPHNFYVDPNDRVAITEALKVHGNVRDWEVQLQDAQGQRFWVLLSSQRLVYEGQECLLTAIVNNDERKQAQEALSQRAMHDALTGLPNRGSFVETLSRTLHRAERRGGSFSILFIDLDHFKQVNDRFGHSVGDLLLQEVAHRLRLCLREGDMVARLGGDEFVVLVEDDGHLDTLTHIVQKIQRALQSDHLLEGHRMKVTASIGISRFPDHGLEINDLLKNADVAMYQAKQGGRDAFQIFSQAP